MRRIRAMFLVLLTSPAYAVGPIFRHKDRFVQQEFDNVYHDLKSAKNVAPSLTLNQLKSYTPGQVGIYFYCSDCATDGLVVSTGTTQGGFGRVSSKITAIN